MNYRTAVIMPLETLGASGTKVIDILVKDPITAFRFEVLWTSYSSGARLFPELDIFSKIELVDGSDVLFSLSGTELAAVHFYEGYPFIYCDCGNLDSEVHNLHLQYDFGRFFRDPLLAFDPKKHSNPQLRITYNRVTPHVLAPTLKLEVTAEVFDDKVIEPIGFLRTTEFHSYAPTATTYEYIDLPTDLVIRKLYLQTRRFGTSAAALLTDAKLSEDNDKKVPFEMTDTNWANLCGEKWGALLQNFWATCGGVADAFFGAPCKYETIAGNNVVSSIEIRINKNSGGHYATYSTTVGDIATGVLSGFLPFFVYCYPFGNDGDPDDWYDLTKVGSLRFRVQSGGSSVSAINNTLLQQLWSYKK